ncbi:HNH endonuclease [Sphingomonas montana]|uniref:HNH endonuclease n=1 Tax=Sphingomonas montana TaxID=1843236 RepID=UPI00096EA6DE|nr:HNH endonuclease [Sphingomonas montana]
MGGRVKGKAGLAEAEARAARVVSNDRCALCGRPLGQRTEWHHAIPKSRGGTETFPVHPICHRAIHAHVSNRDLAASFADFDALRARDDIAAFLRWIADKAPDFYTPTRRARRSETPV